jgi:trimeric autotransporter adhesin
MKHVTFHLPSFLRRVRIHGGEFDSSARAMNREEQVRLLQADLRIVRGSTIERKQMSTTIKRIALVAVAALGLGVLSVAPSQATVQSLAVTVEKDGTASTTVQDTTTAAAVLVTGLLDAGGAADTVTVSIIQKSVPGTSVSADPLLGYLETTTVNTRVKTTAAYSGSADAPSKYESVTVGGVMGITSATAGYVGARFTIQLESTSADTLVAGTYTYTIVAKPFTNGVEGTAVTKDVNIVIAAAPAAAKAVAAAATAFIQAQATVSSWAGVLADSVTAGSLVAGTPVGTIRVVNQSAVGVSAVDTITVAMTGVGYLITGTEGPATPITGRSFVVTNENILDMQVVADGSSGTGTVTITTQAGASFVKTVTFFDTKPAKATATVEKKFIKAGTTAVPKTFAVVVTDGSGNAVTNITALTATATDTATTVGGTATCSTTYDVTDKVYYCSVAGKAADKFGPVAYTITATGADAAATKVTTSATVTFADNVATKAVLAGPATGTPGATVEYTLTLTEKNGYPVADMIYGVGNAAGGVLFSATAADTVASGWAAADAPFNASDSYTSVSGVITSKGKLPIAGTASLSLVLVGDGLQTLAANAIDKTIGKTKLSVSTEITNPGVDAATDAANEATDAANAATDAALAAAEAADAATTAAQEASDAVAALSESVTKLIAGLQAQIKSLAAVVAKIAKKVKA